MKYYRILDDLDVPNRWLLGEINFQSMQEMWNYTRSGEVFPSQNELVVNIKKKGSPIDFTFADFDVIIINEKLSKLLNLNEVQLIPIKIDRNENNHFLMVTKLEFDCVDEQNSEFLKYEIDDIARPDLVGDYRNFFKLIIDPILVNESNIFRVKKYDVAIIVSEKLKNVFEKNYIRGIKFKEVTL